MRPCMGGPSGKNIVPANGYWMASPTSPVTSSAPLLPPAPPSTSCCVAVRIAAAHVVAGRAPADAVGRRSRIRRRSRRSRPPRAPPLRRALRRRACRRQRRPRPLQRLRPPCLPACHRTRPKATAPARTAVTPATIASVRFGRAPNNRNPLPCMRRIASRKNTSVVAGEHRDVAREGARARRADGVERHLRQVIGGPDRRDVD